MRVVRSCLISVALLAAAAHPAWADGGSSPPKKAAHGSHRLLWTLVGAGAGFVGGVFLGLHAFDDATNSDRKVWLTAIGCSVAGAAAGNLLSADHSRRPVVTGPAPKTDLDLSRRIAADPRLRRVFHHGDPWSSMGK